MILKEGDIIKIKSIKNKRVFGIVEKAVPNWNEEVYTIVSRYKPAPKSLLKNISVFSKKKKLKLLNTVK